MLINIVFMAPVVGIRTLIGLLLFASASAFALDMETLAKDRLESVVAISIKPDAASLAENAANLFHSGDGITGRGSGLVISADGYILTSAHVVVHAEKIKVQTHDQAIYTGQLIDQDSFSDVALLKIPASNLAYFDLRKARSEKVRPGTRVFTLGSPYGLTNSLTIGYLSYQNRFIALRNSRPLLQLQLPVYPGNSGGPVFSNDGKLLGLVSYVYRFRQQPTNIAFAIKLNVIREKLANFLGNGRKRTWLGVRGIAVSTEKDDIGLENNGFLVQAIYANSPAEESGLRPGDIIIAVNREILFDARTLPYKGIAEKNPGDSIEISYLQKGEVRHVKVRLSSPSSKRIPRFLAQTLIF